VFTLTVDLAAKFSAACVQDDAGEVHREWDSRGVSHIAFARSLRDAAIDFGFDPDSRILVEDVPYGISSQGQVKSPLRFQGIVIDELEDFLGQTFFVNPRTWQTFFGCAIVPKELAKGMTKTMKESWLIGAAAQAAADRGYSPPDLVAQFIAEQPEGARILKKDTNPLTKNMTDYVDAFLMGRWVREFDGDVRTLSGVQPPFI